MNGVTKQIFTDKIIRLGLLSALILLGLHAVFLGIFYLSLPPVVPLFNQLPWGDARLGTRLEILLPWGITLVFLLFNYFIITKLYQTMPLVSRILSITTLLLSVLAFIFILRTIQLIL